MQRLGSAKPAFFFQRLDSVASIWIEKDSIYFLMTVRTSKEKVYSDIQFNFSENFWEPCNTHRRTTPEFPALISTNSQVFKVTVFTSPTREFLPNEAINVGKFIVLFVAEFHLRPE